MSDNTRKRVKDMYPDAVLDRTKIEDLPDGSTKVTKVYIVADDMVLQETTIMK